MHPDVADPFSGDAGKTMDESHIGFCYKAIQEGSIFTAGEDGNTFLPKRETLKSSLKPAVVFPEPGFGFPRRNIVPEMGVKFLPAHRNILSKLHRIFKELSHLCGIGNGGRRFHAGRTTPSGFRRDLPSH